MLTRRKFLSVAAAGAASLTNLSNLPKLRAAQYDLLIKGGRVIDPWSDFDAIADIGIVGGRFAARQKKLSGATETIDATGKLVVPGLIDIHTHAGRGKSDAGGNAAVGRRADLLALELSHERQWPKLAFCHRAFVPAGYAADRKNLCRNRD